MTTPDAMSGENAGSFSPSFDDSSGGPVTTVIAVSDVSQVGTARRAAAAMASSAGMGESEAGSLALVVTEAATNVARHGGGGNLMLSDMRSRGRPMIEMIAVDKGRGIPDMSRALVDGYSTGGTPGKGLGAIKRMAAEFDLWSAPGLGTVLMARIPISRDTVAAAITSGITCAPLAGETACGDGWVIESIPGGVIVAVADGLGHGHDAALAAGTALNIVRRKKRSPLLEIFETAGKALRTTRGAALQIARIDLHNGAIVAAGVGNISTSVSTHSMSKSISSQPGIVGHQMPRVREQTVPFSSEALLIMHTDGVSTKWRLDAYPGLRPRDPALTAAVIYRDFARQRDDATILTCRAI